MTPKQTQLYWRLWGRACDAQHWKPVRGIITPRPPETDQVSQILDIAANLARANHRAITPDDLRHACHYLSAGKDCSSAQLTNAHLDRFYSICRTLIDPSDLDATIALENPDIGEQKRLVVAIQRLAADPYILSICEDQFPNQYTHPFWEDLPMPSLRALHLTVRNRKPKPHPTTSAPPCVDVSRRTTPVPETVPF